MFATQFLNYENNLAANDLLQHKKQPNQESEDRNQENRALSFSYDTISNSKRSYQSCQSSTGEEDDNSSQFENSSCIDSNNDHLNDNEVENYDLEDMMKWYKINWINEREEK